MTTHHKDAMDTPKTLSLAALDDLIEVASTSPRIFLIRSRDLRRLRQIASGQKASGQKASGQKASAPEFFGRKRRNRRARGRNHWVMLRVPLSQP